MKHGMINPDLERYKANTIELTTSRVPMVTQPKKDADFFISTTQKL